MCEEDEVEDLSIVVPFTKKEYKRLIKSQPEYLYKVKEMKSDYRSLDHMNRLAYTFNNDDMHEIETYDRIHNYKSSAKMPKFKGNLMKDSDYRRY